jgi:glycosyltransferase involved in cell wall biosynthesis
MSRPLVSVIVPALNEAPNVPGLLKRFGQFSVDNPEFDFELILVDDGSTDGTADLVLELATEQDRITVIRLSRSFGSHYAISAGLARCDGDCAVVLGADLQEPPSLLRDFLAHWQNGDDVVWGVRRTRAGRRASQELVSKAFSSIFTRYANLTNYPPEGPSGVLVDRCVIDEVRELRERNRNLFALIAWLGYTQSRVEYDQLARVHGKSRWTRRKMIKMAADSFLQFSSMPLRLCSLIGAIVATGGLLYAIVLIVRSLAGVNTPSGWPTVLVVMLVLGGTQLTLMGIMGEYLWRGVEESRSRPVYVVRDVRVAGAQHPDPRAPRRGRRPAIVAPRAAPSPTTAMSYQETTR